VASPFDELTAFPNRIYPIVKIIFDDCQNSLAPADRRSFPAIGLNGASESIGEKPNPKPPMMKFS
jgi:hypothetical protein